MNDSRRSHRTPSPKRHLDDDADDAVDSREQLSEAETLDSLREALRGLDFGEIQIKVHDGRVVQVTRIEKIRLASNRR